MRAAIKKTRLNEAMAALRGNDKFTQKVIAQKLNKMLPAISASLVR